MNETIPTLFSLIIFSYESEVMNICLLFDLFDALICAFTFIATIRKGPYYYMYNLPLLTDNLEHWKLG